MLSFHNMLSEKLTQLFHTWTHTWTRLNVWVAPFLPGKKCFPPTSSRVHQSHIYTVSTPSFHVWQKCPAASSSAALLRSSSSLAYRKSYVTNMHRPTSAVHVSKITQQSPHQNCMREIGPRDWWLTQIKQQQVACPSAQLPWQHSHLAIEFQLPLPQPFFWLPLVLPALFG